jgi:class 3 adenylate cyclase
MLRQRLVQLTAMLEQWQASLAAGNPAAPEGDAERVFAGLLFTDIVGSTRLAERLGDARLLAVLGRHNEIVRDRLRHFRGREIDCTGDGFFAAFDRPGRAVECAIAIRASLRSEGLAIRAGVHAGECDLADGRISGVAVHVASRIAAIAGAGEILVSATVRDLLAGSGIGFGDSRWVTLRGLADERQLHAVA